MSIGYLKSILENASGIAVLLGRAPAKEQGCDIYKEDFSYDVEMKYGRSPGEITTTTFFNNRPEEFYDFYREALLKRRGEPDAVNFALKKMEDDGKLLGIVTRGYFGLSKRAGCKNVVPLYGDIDGNTCPHCGRHFDADYILSHTPIPYCDACGTMIHPGISLSGELIDSGRMNKAVEIISSADVLLVLGCDLQSHLGSLAKYFTGDRICLVNKVSSYNDEAADCVCIGNVQIGRAHV